MQWLSRLFSGKRSPSVPRAHLFFTNTLTGAKELFIPQKPGFATMYSCGPTVYSRQHIGNLRAAVFSDSVARALKGAGYHVRRVTNITDVGHLVGDGDEGEDKMAVTARQEKATPQEIAERYTAMYLDDLSELNIDTGDIEFPKATDYINEQIALAKTLEEKGFAYQTKNGLAFDTSKFPGYGKLGSIDIAAQKAGARIDADPDKKHPTDFWLWRTARPHDLQRWNSPWGYGNPGWHIECSAMSRALLGLEIDVHTGGEEHVAVHHNNEIAQSEASSGRTFAHYWLHNAHLTLGGEKISKSLGNSVYLSDITTKGFHPLSLRYFFLQAHYRTPLSFTWEAHASAAAALERLWSVSREVQEESGAVAAPSEARERFLAAVRDDLSTAQGLGILWESLRSEDYTPQEKWGLLTDADAHFGLALVDPPAPKTVTMEELSPDVKKLVEEREAARAAKEYATSDRLREEIQKRGYLVEDSPNGPVLTKELG